MKNQLSKIQITIKGKAQFKTLQPIRAVKPEHQRFLTNIQAIFDNEILNPVPVANIPKEVGGVEKSLVLERPIIDKVIKDHGAFPIENFVLTANNPTKIAVLENGKRINIVKQFGQENYFVIGATKNNGYYSVTFFEPERASYIQNKILDNANKIIDFPGGALSSFATPPSGVASQLASVGESQLPGVSKSIPSIPQNAKYLQKNETKNI